MTTRDQRTLPAGWEEILRRYAAQSQSEAFVRDARRYLAPGSPERATPAHEAETLRNLVYAYVEPTQREAALLELATAGSAPSTTGPLAGLLALGGAAVVGLALRRIRR